MENKLQSPQSYHARLLWTFMGTLICLGWAANLVHDRFFPTSTPGIPSKDSWKSTSQWIDLSVSSPYSAKGKMLFWAEEGGSSSGVAVRALESPEIFSQLYPGYRELALDRSFWKKYFSRGFDTKIWTTLPDRSEIDPLHVLISWHGCFDIFEKAGADAILLGSSEAFYALLPQQIGQALGGNAKILSCETTGMIMDTVKQTSEKLARTGKRANWVVWGYSFWNAYSRSKDFDDVRKSKAVVFEEPNLITWFYRMKTSEFFPKTSWTDWIHLNVRDFKKRANLETHQGFYFSTKLMADPAALEKEASQATPYYTALNGMTEQDCNLSSASKELDETLQSLKKVGENVLIYITPTTPLLTGYVPSCFFSAVEKMLRSKSGPHVFVHTGDWKSFGLNYTHYAWKNDEKHAYVNINHTNFSGAQVVTAKVVEWLKASVKQ